MCMRRIPNETVSPAWQTKGPKPMTSGDSGKPQQIQVESKTSSLPPVLENCLGFIKGTFGITT